MKRKEPKYKFNNVLIIDDSELDNFINEKTILANHFSKNVYVNTGAKSALEFLKNLALMGPDYGNIYPEAIFVDLNMPMMDGFQFIEHFKTVSGPLFEKTKLIVLTSSVYEEDKKRTHSISKEIAFLNKPLTKEMLEKI